MSTWFTRLSTGTSLLAVLSLASCQKDEVKTVIQPATAPTVTASANNLTLLQNAAANNALTYTWTPASYGYPAAISYSLQFDKKGGDFSKGYSLDAGTATTKTLTVGDLNSVYQSLGLVKSGQTQVATPLDVRVVASVGTTAPKATSSLSSTTATPYDFCAQPAAANAWAIIGPAGVDWNTDVAMTYSCTAKTYTYTGPLKADSFKFRYGGAWTANYGGPATGGTLVQDGPDIKITTAKNYTIVLTPGGFDSAGKALPGSYTIQ